MNLENKGRFEYLVMKFIINVHFVKSNIGHCCMTSYGRLQTSKRVGKLYILCDPYHQITTTCWANCYLAFYFHMWAHLHLLMANFNYPNKFVCLKMWVLLVAFCQLLKSGLAAFFYLTTNNRKRYLALIQ